MGQRQAAGISHGKSSAKSSMVASLWRGPGGLQSPSGTTLKRKFPRLGGRQPIGPAGFAGINRLLCMFNGFAMPTPFCRPIKTMLNGGIGPPGFGARWTWGPARLAVRPKVGRRRRMGSIGRYIFRTTLGAFVLVLVSLTGSHLADPGVARRRPDDQPGPDRPGVHRHHQPGHPAADPGDRAGRAGGGGVPQPAQARHRFRDHRHERRRHAAVAAAAAVRRRHAPCLCAADGDQRLCRARKPAHAAALAHRGAHRSGQQHRAAGPLHRHRARPRLQHPRAPRQRPAGRAS